MDSNKGNPNSNPNPNNLTVRHANSLEEAIEAGRLAEEEALKIGQSSVTFVNYEMSQERVTALMNRLTGRAGQVNGTAAAEEVRIIMGNAMVEQFGDAGSDNEMSQERVTALMNRLTGRAGQVNGPAAAEEVRRIMGNAMVEKFGDAGSDNEGNSSEEEREYNNRTSGNVGGRGGRGNGGRGNGGSGRGGRGF